jgi:hypothetical protein
LVTKRNRSIKIYTFKIHDLFEEKSSTTPRNLTRIVKIPAESLRSPIAAPAEIIMEKKREEFGKVKKPCCDKKYFE